MRTSSTQRLSVPTAGRPLASATEPLAAIFRAAARVVADGMGESGVTAYDRLFAPRDSRLVRSVPDRRLAAWALLGAWSAVAITHRPSPMTVTEAEEAFLGRSDDGIARSVDPQAIRAADAALAAIDVDALDDLLPYALDPHDQGTRRSVRRDPSQADARAARKRSGIYYTPSDVADYMVSLVLSAETETPVLDPACGTGVFLRSAAQALSGRLGQDGVLSLLHGIDLDARAIDAACFVLAAELGDSNGLELWRLWHLARMNLAEADTLSLIAGIGAFSWPEGNRSRLAEQRQVLRLRLLTEPELPAPTATAPAGWSESLLTLFPERPATFVVVGNPPYAELGDRPDLGVLTTHLASLVGGTVTASTNSYIPFLELMWLVDGSSAPSCLVVPLSLAATTTSPLRSVRRAMMRAHGVWTLRFFDRTPDALFGDDVKQRLIIVSREPSATTAVRTTSMLRWTSRQRSGLFETLPPPTQLPPIDITKRIPKIGFEWEREAYVLLRARRQRLATTLEKLPEPPNAMSIAVGATAYNFLVLYRDGAELSSGTTVSTFQTPEPCQADWAYAVLASNLVYWLWRVDGDGFHVPAKWIQDLPIEWRGGQADDELAALGRTLWSVATHTARTAVNAGRRTVSYPAVDRSLLTQIDRVLLPTVCLRAELAELLSAVRREAVVVGRERISYDA